MKPSRAASRAGCEAVCRIPIVYNVFSDLLVLFLNRRREDSIAIAIAMTTILFFIIYIPYKKRDGFLFSI
jgi:hypothetical protein